MFILALARVTLSSRPDVLDSPVLRVGLLSDLCDGADGAEACELDIDGRRLWLPWDAFRAGDVLHATWRNGEPVVAQLVREVAGPDPVADAVSDYVRETSAAWIAQCEALDRLEATRQP